MREYLLYVNGAFIAGGGGTMPATSPATGERFASVAVADPDDVDRAVVAARKAWVGWAAISPFERAACCESVMVAIGAHRDELAHALSEDQGKPLLAEAYPEVDELHEYFHMAGEDAKRLDGSLPPSTSADARVLVSRVPLGVVGVVSPWNWPYTMGAELLAPALAAGNTVLWVPAPTTSACSGLLAEVIAEGGLPPGVFNFLPGPGPIVGDHVVAHPGVDAVGFIGSVTTGDASRSAPRERPRYSSSVATAPWSCWRTPISSWRRTPRSRRRISAQAKAARPVSASSSTPRCEPNSSTACWRQRPRRCA